MSVKKNFLYNVSYQILIILLPLITTPYISRVIGADGIGVYSYTYSIANYFVLFSVLGLSNYGNRSIAMVRDDQSNLSETFWSIYGLQLISSITMILLYSIYVLFFISDYQLIYWLQLLYITSALLDINWFFFGIEQFKLTVTRNTIIKILTVIAIFVFVKQPEDLWVYAMIMGLGIFSSQLMLWVFLKRYVSFKKPTMTKVLKHLKPNLVLFIPVVAVSIYKVMDKIMIGKMSTMQQVAFYENSEKIINIPIGVITALGVVMLPKMSNLTMKGEKDTIHQYIENSIQFSVFIGFGAMVGLIGVAPVFVPLFLGAEFESCIQLVQTLAVTIVFMSWANVIRTQYLIPQQKDQIYIISTIVGAIVNVIINLSLIPRYGALGAIYGTILAEASVTIYQTFKVRRYLNIKRYLVLSSLFIIPAFVMYIVLKILAYQFDSSIITTAIQIIVGGGIYVGLSMIFYFCYHKVSMKKSVT